MRGELSRTRTGTPTTPRITSTATSSMSEKQLPVFHNTTPPVRYITWSRAILVLALIAINWFLFLSTQGRLSILEIPKNPDSLCPLVQKLDPLEYLYNKDTLKTILHDEKFKNSSLEKLANSVKIPTEVFDDMLNPNSADSLKELYEVEPRWKTFEKLHKYLETTFPLVHKKLTLDKVNKFGLVYTWKGTNKEKKPILLAAHQDVVPVQEETVDQWTYPPFEGGFDGKFLYGSGVSDCKNLLIGLLETIELLIEEDKFDPERTIVLAFGYDEEAAGTGAGAISQFLRKKYGADSFSQIIDEGNEGFETIEGLKFILPATGEKGYLDSIIELYTPGGHSSVPPDHTSIGILAQLITKIEDVQFGSVLTNANPVLNQLQCVAEHSPTVDKKLKSDILRAHVDPRAQSNVIDYLNKDPSTKYLITTSQAIDIIKGGVKSNALPEHVSILVNHRISLEESVALTSEKILNQIYEVAHRFDLGIVCEGKELLKPTPNGYFNYSFVEPLELAPISPINGNSWNVFGGSLKYLYEDLIFPEQDENFVIAPFIGTGNTDTKSYWDLTRNIYRYEPGLPTKNSNIHSVDEKLNFEGHLHIIAFYYYYLQVFDQIDDEPYTSSH